MVFIFNVLFGGLFWQCPWRIVAMLADDCWICGLLAVRYQLGHWLDKGAQD
jgi:hypothetical protein